MADTCITTARVTNETTWTKPPGSNPPGPRRRTRAEARPRRAFIVVRGGRPREAQLASTDPPPARQVDGTRLAFSSSSAPGGRSLDLVRRRRRRPRRRRRRTRRTWSSTRTSTRFPRRRRRRRIRNASTRSAVAEKTVRVLGVRRPRVRARPETEEAPSGGGGGGGGASIPEVAPGEIPPSGDEERAKEPNASDDPKEAARAALARALGRTRRRGEDRWDRIAPKISGDARFRAIATHAERRRVFERYLRDLDATGPGPGRVRDPATTAPTRRGPFKNANAPPN